MCKACICLCPTISFTITQSNNGRKCLEDTNTCYACVQLIFLYLLLSRPKIKHGMQLTHLNYNKGVKTKML